jgi:L-proline---[L-prolyl-carrier protein] ligase
VSLDALVRTSARGFPGRPAVAGPLGSLTYAELDRAADFFAHRLRALGVGPGDRVVVWSAKSSLTVAALQAVLRLGAAYVPVDVTSPAHRVATIVADCAARVVATTADRIAQIEGAARLELVPPADLGPVEPVETPVAPDDLAYILYTSGSTGRPKGVCVSHRNALAFVEWAVAELGAGPDDRFANHAPFTFDLSVLDLYVPFSVGAAVHLVPAELAYAPTRLVEFLHAEEISVWYSVPSVLGLMMADGGLTDRRAPGALRAILFAGEVFPIGGVRRLSGWTGARLLNLYGPTETNVCTFHEVRPADLVRDRPVPIGTACSGDRVWAESEHGGIARPGAEGELLVEGPTVMLGYWGRPPRQGPYRTGDIVRVLPGGGFDFVGRGDHLVKVRGHRVELGEIEAVLAGHPGVQEAVAIVIGGGMGARLRAFVQAGPEGAPGVLALKRFCAERLPRYMIADEIRVVPELPRTANGKIDRLSLAGPTGREED